VNPKFLIKANDFANECLYYIFSMLLFIHTNEMLMFLCDVTIFV